MFAAPLLLLASFWPSVSCEATPPIKVDWLVQQRMLLRYVPPVYPDLAKFARIQGAVRFTMIVGTDGHVRSLHLVSGHPLLVPAAMAAAKRWVFRPTFLNGARAEVITLVPLRFRLGYDPSPTEPELRKERDAAAQRAAL